MAEETKETTALNDLLGGKIAHFSDRSLRRLFQRPVNVQGLVEIAAPDLAKHINFSGLAQLSPGFIPRDLREREADILYRAPFQTADKADEVIIHILMAIGLWLLVVGKRKRSLTRFRYVLRITNLLLIANCHLLNIHTPTLEVDSMTRTIAHELMERGIEIGEQRGEQRGIVRAKREVILKVLPSVLAIFPIHSPVKSGECTVSNG